VVCVSSTTDVAVAVLGGNGKTGRAVCAALRRKGVQPRPVGRAEADRLEEVLAGCASAYLMAPNMHFDEPAFVDRALTACRSAGVPRVVHHSVASPYAPAMPHHLGKAVAEDHVRRSGLDWSVLQPCAYVQNFVPALRAEPPALRVPYDVDAPFGLVDLQDVAEAAATVLVGAEHTGATFELGGPALVGVRQVAEAAAQVLGRAVPAVRIPAAELSADVDERSRQWLSAMFGYYDRHGLPTGPLPLRTLLGREPLGVLAVLHRELRAA
jgi:uncharacterized protein YbjT (DUF2867 family)